MQGSGKASWRLCRVPPLATLDAALPGLQIPAGGGGTLLPVAPVLHLQSFARAAGMGGLACFQAGTAGPCSGNRVQGAGRLQMVDADIRATTGTEVESFIFDIRNPIGHKQIQPIRSKVALRPAGR